MYVHSVEILNTRWAIKMNGFKKKLIVFTKFCFNSMQFICMELRHTYKRHLYGYIPAW